MYILTLAFGIIIGYVLTSYGILPDLKKFLKSLAPQKIIKEVEKVEIIIKK